TLTEVENIKTSFEDKHRQVITGADATEASVQALSAHAPNILHIATHGFYYTEKEKKMMDARKQLTMDNDRLGAVELEDKALTRSGMAFAGANNALQNDDISMEEDDGILTAQEISKLDLRGLDLVVLSACETGMGDIAQGEGVFGLQRGFKKAGAGTIVMSLWKVDDNATQMMMTQFYKNLCDGMDKHEALHTAQKHLREYKDEKGENKYNYPHYWAGFIILD
ncbi:MAG: CHAT domain-containing protein, partial [Prevotella sp.]|nr:CHAT domain-containing protein [Prevotella sp.]